MSKPPVRPQATAKPSKPPPFQIRAKAQRAKERFIKMLIYGDYGAGKTFLAGTAAAVESMNDVLLISAESGDLTLDSVEQHGFENIDSIEASSFRTVASIFDFLKVHCTSRDADDIPKLKALQARLTGIEVDDIPDDKVRRYRTVIIDSLSEVEIYCMNQLLGISDTTGLQDETQSAEWAEYKKQFHMMQRLVRSFRDLPIHVIMTCARQYQQDEQKRMLFSPNLTGKLSGQVQGFVDIVGYLTTGQPGDDGAIPRRMFVQPVGRYAAKNRISSYKKAYFDNPTMKSILTSVGMINDNS